MTNTRSIKDVRGKTIAITGQCWTTHAEIARLLRRQGGRYSPDLTRSTQILVRGQSGQWKYGDYGRKEERAYKYALTGSDIRIVSGDAMRRLLEKGTAAKPTPLIAGEPVDWIRSPSYETFADAAKRPGPLDREHTVVGRAEQSYLRNYLLNGRRDAPCAICGRTFPRALLIASHIKARSVCTRTERLDLNIAFLLCALGCDTLYERGFASVDGDGKVVTCAPKGLTKDLAAVLRSVAGRRCRAWSPETQKYLGWHLTNRFMPSLG
jgi:hypothetical protein